MPVDLVRLSDARSLLFRGELLAAEGVLDELGRLYPRNVPVGALRQDVALARLDALELESEARSQAEEDLRKAARARAEREPTPTHLVLAARLEDDRRAAALLLDQAQELDPRCVWAPYGRAHGLLQDARPEEAGVELERALELDPWHLPSRRLSTQLLLRAGETRRAERELEAWIDDARGDGRVDPDEVVQAELDLATLHLAAERTERAYEAALAAEPADGPTQARRAALLAAASLQGGSWRQALEWSRVAMELAPELPLPRIQEAQLLERYGSREAAIQAWERAIDLLESTNLAESGAEADLSLLLERISAQVHLERLRAAEPRP